MCPRVELDLRETTSTWETTSLPVHDAAHDAFVTLPCYSSTREDDVQSVGQGALRHPVQEMHFTLHHLMGYISCYALAVENPLMQKLWYIQYGSVARATPDN